ncbi:MAG TPA: cellulose binding domain-containing protein, partial [Micromonosporaceae bacterium]|nr:cellulose binding domain-containing protein [Micromonosporaceae bacterium]
CRVVYSIFDQWTNAFRADFNAITNTGATAIPAGWELRFSFANGQAVTSIWNALSAQTDAKVAVTNQHWNPALAPGQTFNDIGFIGSWNNVTNARPVRFTLNTTRCTVG